MSHHVPPRVIAEGPATTGALFVMFDPSCDQFDACDSIERTIGRRPARSADYRSRLFDLSQEMRSSGAAYFDDFGVAILDPTIGGMAEDEIMRMGERDEVVLVRPEYKIYAMGWLCRMLGLERAKPASVAPQTPGASSDGLTWGLKAVGAIESGLSGAGVKVAVLDTGFDFEHPDFQGRNIVSQSFVPGEAAQDGLGHGAHVAGTIAGPAAPKGATRYGVAPDAELYIAKVLGNDGRGREGDMLAGILWALEQGCQVVNMSLGRRPLPQDSTGDYDRIGKRALDQGALIIAAAGNESARSRGSIQPVGAPANARSIMAVGAVDDALKVADFSNGGLNPDGGAIDISAPGVDVLSSVPGAQPYAPLSGTSMATPHVSGVAALLAQSDPSLRGQALWTALTSAAKGIGAPAQDVGAGLVQAKRPPAAS